MKDIMADYVKLPELEEYREWFKDHFDLYREDGILQVTMKTPCAGAAPIIAP